MAAMPEEQSGLLAEATKFTGEPSVEPLAGDVTVTTGVVANAAGLRIWIRVANPATSRNESANRYHCIRETLAKQRLAAAMPGVTILWGKTLSYRVDSLSAAKQIL
jgi:hypothetical protein